MAQPSDRGDSEPKSDHEWAIVRMIDNDLRGRGISDERVLEAMRRVPRHLFVLPSEEWRAYEDRALQIGWGQTISQPYVVAATMAALRIRPDARALDVGTGSGYAAAVMAELGAEVYSIERIPELADIARENLRAAGCDHVQVTVGDGSLGIPEHAPYDCIAVAAAAPEIPPALMDQMADGGRMVIPIGPPRLQDLVLVERRGSEYDRQVLFGCAFVPLLGEEGWTGS